MSLIDKGRYLLGPLFGEQEVIRFLPQNKGAKTFMLLIVNPRILRTNPTFALGNDAECSV